MWCYDLSGRNRIVYSKLTQIQSCQKIWKNTWRCSVCDKGEKLKTVTGDWFKDAQRNLPPSPRKMIEQKIKVVQPNINLYENSDQDNGSVMLI